jgi:hypothetical protein
MCNVTELDLPCISTSEARLAIGGQRSLLVLVLAPAVAGVRMAAQLSAVKMA